MVLYEKYVKSSSFRRKINNISALKSQLNIITLLFAVINESRGIYPPPTGSDTGRKTNRKPLVIILNYLIIRTTK